MEYSIDHTPTAHSPQPTAQPAQPTAREPSPFYNGQAPGAQPGSPWSPLTSY